MLARKFQIKFSGIFSRKMLTMTGKVLSSGLAVLCVCERERERESRERASELSDKYPCKSSNSIFVFFFFFLPNYGKSPVD
jgi:hypothetical protein